MLLSRYFRIVAERAAHDLLKFRRVA